MHTPQEVELKLDCDLEGLATIRNHPRLKAARRKPLVNMTSVYFDTPGRDLQKAGLTLRLRTGRGRPIQTTKAEGDGLLSRPEWERRVAGPGLDLAALAETPVGALVGDVAEVAPLFTVKVGRRVFLVEENGAQIEVALDEGRVFGEGGPSEAICEVELELKSGPAASLFALAREFSAAAPLRLGVRTKAERGYALSGPAGSAAGVVHAAPVALHERMTAAEAFRAIAHACLRQLRLNEPLAAEGRSVEALHQLRVAIRRLRSAVSLFGDLVEDGEGQAIFDALKQRTEPLGRSRNLDVLMTETMPAERERRPDLAGLLNLEKQLEGERAEAKTEAGAALHAEDWRGLVLDIVAWINAGPWLAPQDDARAARLAMPVRDFAAEALERRFGQVRKRGRKLAKVDDETRHRLRIAAKKLRYGTEFFGCLHADGKGAARVAAFHKALKKMQNRLGELNDIATARAVIEAAANDPGAPRSSSFAAGMTVADLESRKDELLDRAAKAYDGLMDAKPFWR